ncbi:MAG: DUF2066 domain-containing protein, partial [Alphaproteobacteria bacterium]|nr:DUF2066 domain-containing protein [Alphaproteobacteria bacterium]
MVSQSPVTTAICITRISEGWRKIARPGLIGAMFLLGLWFGASGAALAGSVWSIDNIQVDQINADPRTARELAIQESQFKALPILLKRLTHESDWSRLPTLSANAMSSAVEGFEVNAERASAQRYTAQLTVSFYPEAIRSLLRSTGIAIVEPSSRPILVLPVLMLAPSPPTTGPPALSPATPDEAKDLTLWDDRNPWRAAWLKDRQNGILVPWFVARVEDFPASTRPEALTTEPNSYFNKRLLKNDIGGILLASLQRKEEGWVVGAKIWTATNVQDLGTTAVLALPAMPNESLESQMRRALDLVSLKLDSRWKTSSQRDTNSQVRHVDMVFQIQSVHELIAVQKILDNVAQIRSRSLVALHRRAAEFQLEYAS